MGKDTSGDGGSGVGIGATLRNWLDGEATSDESRSAAGRATDAPETPERVEMGRRSYLKMVGVAAATASVAGCTGAANDAARLRPASAFGYGGAAVIEQTSSLDLSVSESESNDRRSTAMLLDPGATVTGTLTPSDVDWYAVDLTRGQELVVDFERTSDEGLVAVFVYDTEGEWTDVRYLAASGPVSARDAVEESGRHYVQIVDVKNGSDDYTLTVDAEDGQTGTETPTPTETPTETPTPTPTPTETPTATPTPTPTPTDGQEPYGGQARSIPGQIQAEQFDTGGDGVAYFDTTADAKGGAHRTDEAVDIEATADTSGGYNVGWMDADEWLEYTVDVTAGTYDVDLRVASPADGKRFRVLLDWEELGVVEVPNTGGWQSWTTVTLNDITLSGGEGQTLRVEVVDGDANLNWVEFTSNQPVVTPTPTPTPDDDYGVQGYGMMGYGGID